MSKIFIGTSGYNYDDWVDVFYPKDLPKKEWLSFYAKHFNTVEINATFYGNFKKEVFEKWGREVGNNFHFSIKGPRFITHVKRLKDVEGSLGIFFENAKGLGLKLSIILWQFPKSFKFNDKNFERLKKMLKQVQQDKKRKPRNAFEFRDESWLNNQVYKLLNKYQCGFVISDSPLFPKAEISTGGFSYIRFHGPSVLYSSSYRDKELLAWAKKIKTYLEKDDVYCYFNNDVLGFAVENAKTLKSFLNEI